MSYSINKFNSPPNSRSLSNPKDIFPSQFINTNSNSDQFKQKILSQNKALAKKNSILMTKVADLETKISELIQHNIELRAINAKSEDQKRKWLEDKLNIIENGVSQRFEEMFHMFHTIRSNEGLSTSSMNLNNVIQNVSHESIHDKTVSFHDVKSPVHKNRSERRRKSARRQSIYIAPPPSPPQHQGHEEEEEQQQQPEEFEKINLPQEFDTPSVFHDDNHNPINHEIDVDQPSRFYKQNDHPYDENVGINEAYIPEEIELEDSKVNEQDEIDHAITLSPIKFSSPKRPDSHPKFSVYTETNDQREKPSEEEINLKIQKLAEDSVKVAPKSHGNFLEQSKQQKETQDLMEHDNSVQVLDSAEFSDKAGDGLYQDIDKIKHTKSKKQKQKSSKDEAMPKSVSSDLLSTRKSRTRGKSVNYAEPSLRKKMRRESEQLTDAVVENDLSIKLEPISQPQSTQKFSMDEDLLKVSRESPIKNNKFQTSSPINKVVVKPRVEELKQVENVGTHLEPEENEQVNYSREEEPKSKPTPLIEQDSRNITKRRKPLGTLNQNKVQKRDSKQSKKMQLDIDAAELSVFDLVDECEVGVPKTYKNAPDVSMKKSSRRSSASGSRRNSMLL